MNSIVDDYLKIAGFPHSDTSGSKLICQLPEDFRRLTRPSSPPTAKASTVCTYSLDHISEISLVMNELYNFRYIILLVL